MVCKRRQRATIPMESPKYGCSPLCVVFSAFVAQFSENKTPYCFRHELPPVAIGMFSAAMDSTIVASSFASIGSDFKQLQNTSWIATGYMLTLTSFQCVRSSVRVRRGYRTGN